MSNDVVFVPEAMYEMAGDLEGWAGDLRATGDDVDEALERFRSSSSEFVPALPAHGEAIDRAADLTVVLGEEVAQLAAAAEEADRLGVDDIVRAAAFVVQGADQIVSGSQGSLRLTRAGVYGRRVVEAGAPLWNIARQYGSRPKPDLGLLRARTHGGAAMRRAAMKPIRSATYRNLQRQRRTLLNRSNQGRFSLRNNRPLFGGSIRNFLAAHPRLGTALRWGGRGLGGAAAGLAFSDAYGAFQAGDTVDGIASTLNGVGSLMMMTPNPVVAGVGAVLVVGTTIYQHRETLGRWAESGASAVADGVSSVVGGAGRVLDSIF